MPPDRSPVQIARGLLRTARQGSLATLMQKGAPYCSLVAVASHPDGSPILLISRLAVHTQNLLADDRVSLLLHEASDGDPLQAARIMVAGTAVTVENDGRQLLRRRYLAAHPAAELFADFPDFLFVRLQITGVHLVAGFGRIADIAASEVLTEIADAAGLLEAEEDAVAHMNEDHAEALSLYATKLLHAPAGDWRCTGVDPDGLDLAAENAVLRLNFPERVKTPGELRAVLVKLAAAARSEAGPTR